jgi:hypothetical protein
VVDHPSFRQGQTHQYQKPVTHVPYETGAEVYTFWDLGVDDSMTIWFGQFIGKETRWIDYYENSGMGLAHYAKILKEKPYVYGDHYMPHDAAVAAYEVKERSGFGITNEVQWV